MDPFRLAVTPRLSLGVLAFALAGVGLGACSGLVPGLHANNFALLLAAVAPGVPAPPTMVAAAMLAAGVVHTFLDVVPALALGVPDATMAPMALPGHRLVLAGRGREALRLSALGSALAVAFALPLAVPVTWAMTRAYPTLRANLPLVLGAVVVVLLVTESSWLARVGGAVAFLLAAALGWLTLDLDPRAPLAAGGVLTPLFAGLFGAPVLLDALDGAGVPPQEEPELAMARPQLAATAGAGTLAGAAVGYLPGVSAAVATVLALPAVPSSDDARGFLVAASGANTSTALFALFALVALGTPRTGVLVAVERVGAPRALPGLVAPVLVAAAAGFALVLLVGDGYLRVVGNSDYRRVSLAVLGLLAVLSWLFAGPVGLPVLVAATLVGLVPPRVGARRVHLMGVLLGPLAVGG